MTLSLMRVVWGASVALCACACARAGKASISSAAHAGRPLRSGRRGKRLIGKLRLKLVRSCGMSWAMKCQQGTWRSPVEARVDVAVATLEQRLVELEAKPQIDAALHVLVAGEVAVALEAADVESGRETQVLLQQVAHFGAGRVLLGAELAELGGGEHAD